MLYVVCASILSQAQTCLATDVRSSLALALALALATMAPNATLAFSTLAVATLAFSAIAALSLYLAYRCGRSIGRKEDKDENPKAKAKAKSKAKAKPKSCKHEDYTRAGSNQYKERKRCKKCDLVFEIIDKPVVGSD
jgi:membrane protein implicated in regulation of membrane protease activity